MQQSAKRLPFLMGLAMFFCAAMSFIGFAVTSVQTEYLRTPARFGLNLLSITYGGGSTGVEFRATERLPGASGEAKIERKDGFTEIEIELDEMKPAWSFGGDFSTYLLWAISPEGHLDNLGEFVLKGNRSKLNVSTLMDTFALIVTAEPHFMVEKPSSFTILTNLAPRRRLPRPAEQIEVEIVTSHPTYRYERATLTDAAEVKGEVRSALRQAKVAVQLAERAGSERLAPAAFKEAQDSLLMAEGAAETRSPTHEDVERMARRTVRMAALAERLAISNAASLLSVGSN